MILKAMAMIAQIKAKTFKTPDNSGRQIKINTPRIINKIALNIGDIIKRLTTKCK